MTTAEIDAALAQFGTARTAEPSPLQDSVLNDNVRVETAAGPRFLRFIQQKRTREVVDAEHRAMLFAQKAGIPVALPLPALDGSTIGEVDGRLVALFPFLHGRTAVRRAITAGEGASLGGMQGRMQAALKDYDDPVLGARGAGETLWDTQAAISTLENIEWRISSNLSGIDDRHARRGIRMQLMLLASGQTRPPADFAHLPVQIEHGDYHERNVMLEIEGDDVVSVVDWERIRMLPRAFQLVRALDFMGLLHGGPLDEYLAAYGREYRLDEAECHDAVDQWWQSALHSTWPYTVVFEEGEQRAARFLPEVEPRLRQLSDEGFRRKLGERIARHAAR